MAFKPANLIKLQPSTLFTDPATIPSVQPQTPPVQFWLYNSGGDSLATVDTDGYFNYFGNSRAVDTLLYNNGQLFNVGDVIWAVCNDDNAWLQITAVTPTITTSVNIADPASVNTAAIQDGAVTNPKLAADAVTNVKVAAAAAIDFSKLAALTSGRILVGSVGNVPTAVAMSGDATIVASGALTIANSAITNVKVAAAAAIDYSKLAALTSGNILVGSVGNVPTAVAMSGDATIIASGALTIANDAITTVKILNANVTLAKLAAGITPSHIVKFAAQYTTVGGAAAEAINIPGVLNTDLAFVQLVAPGTGVVSVGYAVCTANTLTVTFSANPGNDAIINYQILRAAA